MAVHKPLHQRTRITELSWVTMPQSNSVLLSDEKSIRFRPSFTVFFTEGIRSSNIVPQGFPVCLTMS